MIFLIWISWITFLVLGNKRLFDSLMAGDKQVSLLNIISEIKDKLEQINKKVIELEGQNFLQKIGFKRYNPFGDTGGQQSFIISILDKKGSGVVISSLYGRNGTRWFAKKVESGKGTDLELTEEEKESLCI